MITYYIIIFWIHIKTLNLRYEINPQRIQLL